MFMDSPSYAELRLNFLQGGFLFKNAAKKIQSGMVHRKTK